LHNQGNIPEIVYSDLIQNVYHTHLNNKTKVRDHLVLLLHDRMFSTEHMKKELYHFLFELKKDANLQFSTIEKHPFIQEPFFNKSPDLGWSS